MIAKIEKIIAFYEIDPDFDVQARTMFLLKQGAWFSIGPDLNPGL